MASLKELSLAGCKLTDSQLAGSRGLKSLESLDLSSNHRFTDAGLAYLEGLHKTQMAQPCRYAHHRFRIGSPEGAEEPSIACI